MTRPPPRILFRADASPALGGGHIVRCLALAHTLRELGAETAFSCAPGSAETVPALVRSGQAVTDAAGDGEFALPAGWDGADAIFVDLYTSTAADETRMREKAPVIAAIEDLPGRVHDCDLLVDPLPGGSPFAYSGRVPGHCHVMAGGAFALLRPEFSRRRREALDRHRSESPLSRVLVSMGLTDPGDISGTVARIALDALPDARIDVVLGPRAASRTALEALAQTEPRLTVAVDIDDMARRMTDADLAIGAGGGSALERCALGLPSIAVILAGNQRETSAVLHADGALLAIDGPDRVAAELPGLIASLTPKARARMAGRAAAVCDGRGAARVADALLALIGNRTGAGPDGA